MYLTDEELKAIGRFLEVHEEEWLAHACAQRLTDTEAKETVEKLATW